MKPSFIFSVRSFFVSFFYRKKIAKIAKVVKKEKGLKQKVLHPAWSVASNIPFPKYYSLSRSGSEKVKILKHFLMEK